MNNLNKLGNRNYPSTFVMCVLPQPAPAAPESEKEKNIGSGRMPLLPSSHGDDENNSHIQYYNNSNSDDEDESSTWRGNTTQPDVDQKSLMSDIINNMSDDIKRSTDMELDYGLSSRFSNSSERDRERDLTSLSSKSIKTSARKKLRSKSAIRGSIKTSQERPKTSHHQHNPSSSTNNTDSVEESHIYSRTQSQSLSAHRNSHRTSSSSQLYKIANNLNGQATKQVSSPFQDEMDTNSHANSTIITFNSSTSRLTNPAVSTNSSVYKQVASKMESEFGIPLAKKSSNNNNNNSNINSNSNNNISSNNFTSQSTFLPVAVPSQRSQRSQSTMAPLFSNPALVVNSENSLHQHHQSSHSILSTSTKAAMENDPYLNLELSYNAFSLTRNNHSGESSNSLKSKSGLRANSASRGILNKSQAEIARKVEQLDFISW